MDIISEKKTQIDQCDIDNKETHPLDAIVSSKLEEKEQNQEHREFVGLFIDPVSDSGKYRCRQNHLDTQGHVTAHALIVFAQIHLDSLATTSVRATKSV